MNVKQPIHVGIISDSGTEIQRSQGFGLIGALGRVRGKFGGQVALHHSGSSQADNIGRAFAVRAGWQVELHPACKAAGVIPWRTAALESRSEICHPARMRAERDMDVIRMSHLIVAVESDWDIAAGLVRTAESEGRAVIHIKRAKLNALPAVVYSGVVHDWLVDEWR